ncbi:hypothetical protein [Mycolicibacter longobardus]|nr:hypothetical protein [Mycolicibacter longobardus]MCV7384395.1 hypothetical protein [Mycolicibacter longobardus]
MSSDGTQRRDHLVEGSELSLEMPREGGDFDARVDAVVSDTVGAEADER